MKKSRLGIVLIAVVIMSLGASFALSDPQGPAPNSGDGIPDGSGHDEPWQNEDKSGPGPAPNSGDGIPDGSGF